MINFRTLNICQTIEYVRNGKKSKHNFKKLKERVKQRRDQRGKEKDGENNI